MAEKITLTERLQRHPVAAMLSFIGSIASIVGLWFVFVPPLREPPGLPDIAAGVREPTMELSVVSADAEAIKHNNRLLGFVPWGADYLLSFDIVLRNEDRAARQSCFIHYATSGLAGESGDGGLFVGHWTQWFGGDGAGPFFELPAASTFQGPFFSFPKPEPFTLAHMRLRVRCDLPNLQISPWYEVDLSMVRWWQ